jgi:hypothetical protein
LKCKMTKTKQLEHNKQNHKTRLEFILGWGYRLPFFFVTWNTNKANMCTIPFIASSFYDKFTMDLSMS